jgi:hypothetical protein
MHEQQKQEIKDSEEGACGSEDLCLFRSMPYESRPLTLFPSSLLLLDPVKRL